ncbi:MAG: HAMP domain-containing histidine kinase [Bacteroidetes bacterium]|nr:HAMP domain-containing histidine kinase [Bacteroidota bacterium]
MNIYSRKQLWKLLLLGAALLIVAASLWYSSRLVKKISVSEKRNVELWADAVRRKALMMEATNQLYAKIASEERKKVEIWAEASGLMSDPIIVKDNNAFTLVVDVIRNNETVPVIVVDSIGEYKTSRNLDTAMIRGDKNYIAEQLSVMRKQHDSIPIDVSNRINDPKAKPEWCYLFYRDSKVFDEIRESYVENERSFIREVASNPSSTPAIYYDSTSAKIIAFGNLDSVQLKNDSAHYLKIALKDLTNNGDTVRVTFSKNKYNIIYYSESPQLRQLRYYPVFQFIVIGMFLLVAYLLFSTARRAEQNNVWVGMAKETAHQLGTPLSSLIAWLEYLKMKGVNDEMTKEIAQDVKRLEMITERFSKIGSQPKLAYENIVDALTNSVDYIRSRSPRTVNFNFNVKGKIDVPMNVPLFAWVIENLCRNAVDAMDGTGAITIEVTDLQPFVYVDITDTGKGIPRSKQRTIFEPGFTTKQRGWGLGLSLCKRIVEQYHNGKIFVKRSEPGKGTTFRIVLNK